jgi:hypothetical protein
MGNKHTNDKNRNNENINNNIKNKADDNKNMDNKNTDIIKLDYTSTFVHFHEDCCTLSEEARKTLRVYKVRIPKNELKCIDQKCKYYMLKQEITKNNELVHNEQSKGYSYIFSEVCSPYLPFHNLDYCCYICREWNGCEESRNVVFLWFWKKIEEKDTYNMHETNKSYITAIF